jgi:stearoyl-CoA desaturase (delta-9 desaturase)
VQPGISLFRAFPAGLRSWPPQPFVLVHVAAAGALVVGFRWYYPLVAVASYYFRMFWVTVGYHRYFSHRAFKTSRVFQFALAFLAMTSAQKGVLWWAAHHRNHHRYSDQPGDLHSPLQSGLWWSHVGWILSDDHSATHFERIRDFARFPELRWLNRFYLVPPAVYFGALGLVGGWPLVIWGGVIGTILLWHGSFAVNSLGHLVGSRRYPTADGSRNSWWLAVLLPAGKVGTITTTTIRAPRTRAGSGGRSISAISDCESFVCSA